MRDDFNESRDLIREELPRRDALKRELLATIQELRTLSDFEEQSVDPETIEQLRLLGYVQ